MNFLQSAIKWAALAMLVLTVLVHGSYPNWAAGPAIACFCALGALLVLLCAVRGSAYLDTERTVRFLGVAVVFGLTALVGYDCVVGVGGGRVPAVSVRQFPFAIALLAAAMLGSQFKTLNEKRIVYLTMTCLGVLLAVLAFVEKLGWDAKTFGPSNPSWSNRPAGILLNANRAAVMLSLCLSCALALLASAFFVQGDSERSAARRGLEPVIWGAVALTIAAGMVSTLSRLSILSFGAALCVVTFVWTRSSQKGISLRDYEYLPLADRIQRGVFIILPLVVLAAWVAWTLSFGGHGLNERLREIENGDGRLSILKSASPLMLKQPLLGIGLGGFDSAFTKYQPADLGGRWNELHWDWFQTAIEAGWPMFMLLIALTAAWVRSWWRGLDALRQKFGRSGLTDEWVLRLVPWAGCATVLLCSVADFPMREPGIAFAFFFLAAIQASPVCGRQENSGVGGNQAREVAKCGLGTRLLAVPLCAVLVAGAFVAGRNGWACVNSPWMGQLSFPPSPGLVPSDWEKAIEIDPGDPQFHYFLSQAANHNARAASEVYEKGLRHAKIAAQLKPTDYLIPWVESSLAEKLGRLEDADAFSQRAVALNPESPLLHRDRALFFLRTWVQPSLLGSLRREEGVQKAVEEFRFNMKRNSGAAEDYKRWMLAAGCLPEEVSLLWEGTGARECVLRARFFAEQGMWEAVGQALRPVDSLQLQAGSSESIWYHGLNAILDIERREDASAIAHWKQALDSSHRELPSVVSGNYSEQVAVTGYAVRALDGMSPDRLETIAVGLASNLIDFQDMTSALAMRLAGAGKNVAAERLLKEAAGISVHLNQLRAIISMQLDDEAGAAEHAFKALQYGGQNNSVSQWYTEFMLKVDARKKKRRGLIP